MAGVSYADPSHARAPTLAACKHCLTPLAAGSVDDFCCIGCRHVHDLLQDSGLTRYYALRGARPLAPVGDHRQAASQVWLDAAALALGEQGGVRRFALDVQGIQCGACTWLMEAVFKRQPDAFRLTINPALGQLTAVVGEGFSLHGFVHEVEDFGYRLGPARKSNGPGNGLLLRTGICLALAANTGFLSATAYFGLTSGPLHDLIKNGSFTLATLSVLVGGSYFADRAYQGIRRGILHLDFPIALGMGLAYLGSVWSLYFGGATANYLDTVSVFIALMLVGRVTQERLVERNRRQLLSSDGASGLLARRLRDGRIELVPCTELRCGDQVLVCPGEVVPVTSRLDDERATCSLDWINGESEPRAFVHHQELVAGAVNVAASALRATASSDFERSDLDALLKDDPSRGQRLAGDFWDRLARIYGVLVLMAAGVGALVWTLGGHSLPEILDVTTAVLVVTCPCAFGLATPLAYELAVAGLRKSGLFVRDGGFFDRAAKVRRLVFDKTGTLTTGALALREPEVLRDLAPRARAILYTLSSHSNHPKSVAIARTLAAHDAQLQLLDLEVAEVAGKGMQCTMDGSTYRLGAPEWVVNDTRHLRGPLFGQDGIALAELETVEVTRPDAGAEVAALAHEGYELWIASGDSSEHVFTLAESLGIPRRHAWGGLSPQAKRDLVSRRSGRFRPRARQGARRDTLMIGDGINDSLALSSALCSGTPAVDRPFVPARTDFYFLTAGLGPIRLALHVAKAVRRVVINALVFATVYNVFAVGLAYAGLMRPWLAAVLMPASSILVLTYTSLALSARRTLWKS